MKLMIYYVYSNNGYMGDGMMLDCHIHLEKGEYTLGWINEFVKTAVWRGMNEICLLEHCYLFQEFVTMYEDVCAYSPYIQTWFNRKAGTRNLSDYLRLIEKVRSADIPVKIRFGLEICYFKEYENRIHQETKDLGLDFLLGSVHYVDNFAFDHKPEHWKGVDVDSVYRRYFKTSVELAKSGLFNGIAHPDSIKVFGHQPSYSLLPFYDSLAKEVAKRGMYAEQNSGIYRRSSAELGMNAHLIIAMKKYGVEILTASDAHKPEDVGANIPDLQALL